jgi:hypothetical protein
MHLIVYSSRHTGSQSEITEVLDDIVRAAKENNPGQQITGVLFYQKGQFVQLLEGEEPQLRELLAIIERDPRHTDIRILLDRKVSQRGFSDWNMDSFNLDEETSLELDMLGQVVEIFQHKVAPRGDLVSNTLKQVMTTLERVMAHRGTS